MHGERTGSFLDAVPYQLWVKREEGANSRPCSVRPTGAHGMASVEAGTGADTSAVAEREGVPRRVLGAEPGTATVTLETNFRGDIRSLSWVSTDERCLQSQAEFARVVAGLYELPLAWTATIISYVSTCVSRPRVLRWSCCSYSHLDYYMPVRLQCWRAMLAPYRRTFEAICAAGASI